jgi:AcrR family transcriptional regulator
MGAGRGRRGEPVQHAVLLAALAELVDHGYAALTMDNVARRAGVHKTTVYRRWPDRESLVTEAVLTHASAEFELPDTGNLEADLHMGARRLVSWLGGPVGVTLVALLQSDAARLPAINAAKKAFYRARAERVQARIDKAVRAGQLPPGTEAMKLITALVAPIYFRLLVSGEPVTEADADFATTVTLAAAAAGVLTSSGTV